MTTTRPIVLLAVLAATTTLAAADPGAAGRAEEKKKTKAKSAAEASERVPVWPLPPEPARIRYVTSYRGADDFNTKKKSSRWRTLVFGQDDAGQETPDQLVKPYGVATSPSGLLYVSDTASGRVFDFDARQPAARTAPRSRAAGRRPPQLRRGRRRGRDVGVGEFDRQQVGRRRGQDIGRRRT